MCSIEALSTNINPGIEYELAFAYLLIKNKAEKEDFLSKVIRIHPYSIKIKKIANLLKHDVDRFDWRNLKGIDYDSIAITTQIDEVGPADIILDYPDNSKIGLSIKFQNKCHLNITGRDFLAVEDIKSLNCQLRGFTRRYIDEMTEKYGSTGNWFRRRRRSCVTDEFIDMIRTRVIAEWGRKSDDEKHKLINKIFHNYAAIPFWVVSVNRSNNRLSMTINKNPIHLSPDRKIILEKHKTSFINLISEGELIGKMQIKFNNGFLEKCKTSKPDIVLNGIKANFGSPFSSWNFSLI